MVQMLAHGLSSAALFIMAGQIYERLHTRDMTVMGGMGTVSPPCSIYDVLLCGIVGHTWYR